MNRQITHLLVAGLSNNRCVRHYRHIQPVVVSPVLSQHAEVRTVKIFGSRATTHFEEYSDVDLALWGDLDFVLIGRILAELDELALPYKFDVKAYDNIKHAPLRRHIDEVGRILYEDDASAP